MTADAVRAPRFWSYRNRYDVTTTGRDAGALPLGSEARGSTGRSAVGASRPVPGRAKSATKGVFIVRQTTMITACRPTTRRPSRPSPSPSTWSCSRSAVTRSARWWCAEVNRRSRAGGRCPAASSKPMRTSERPQRVSSWRRPGSPRTTRWFPLSGTALTSNNSPPTGTRGAIRGCGSSASPISRWPPTCRRPGRAGTRTVPAGHLSVTCSDPRADTAATVNTRRRWPSITRGSWPTVWSGPAQDRVLLAGHRFLPAGVHGRRTAQGVRSGLGCRARPEELPPQGNGHARVPGALRRHDHQAGGPSRAAVPVGRGHRPQPTDAPARGLIPLRRGESPPTPNGRCPSVPARHARTRCVPV